MKVERMQRRFRPYVGEVVPGLDFTRLRQPVETSAVGDPLQENQFHSRGGRAVQRIPEGHGQSSTR
jgi:hypothetical protein